MLLILVNFMLLIQSFFSLALWYLVGFGACIVKVFRQLTFTAAVAMLKSGLWRE